jgi:hypothetical protein
VGERPDVNAFRVDDVGQADRPWPQSRPCPTPAVQMRENRLVLRERTRKLLLLLTHERLRNLVLPEGTRKLVVLALQHLR